MPQPGAIERRLAAIMAMDVAGYSRLMGVDEVRTLSALKEHRRERIDPAIARYHGRIVKTTGDGLLVEFASVVDAVICGVAIQRSMLAFNAGIHSERQIVLRIGINIGDIIIDGNDIFGDGVNVAARLEALCEPGGICISRSANDQVRDKLSLSFADRGEQTVKNIARAIGVFGLGAQDIATLPEHALPSEDAPRSQKSFARSLPYSRKKKIVASGIIVLLLVGGGWWSLHDKIALSITTSQTTRPVAYSPQDRRQSVIVLPFENTSGDPSQDNLAATMTRDVTNRIVAIDHTIPTVPVQTAAAYRGKPIDLRAIRQTHNVHFAIVGGVRRENGRLIGSISTFDTEDDRVIWSSQFNQEDREENYQNILHKFWAGSNQAALDAEAAKALREHPNALDKRDLMFQSQVSSLQPFSKEHFQTRLSFTERALAIDPNYAWALSQGARLLADRVMLGFSTDPTADLSRARTIIDRALQLKPDDWDTLRQNARVLRAQGDFDGAEAVVRKLLVMNPQSAYRYVDLGVLRMIKGHPEEMLQNMQTARSLATIDDDVPVIDTYMAVALLANSRFDEAISQARLATGEFTKESGRFGEVPWVTLIAAEYQSGNVADAKAELQKFLSAPRTLVNLVAVKTMPYLAANTNLLDGLRGAGMPEQ
jgi:class 3 adenylate cyclase/TolB-like protein